MIALPPSGMRLTGRCWRFGDNVGIDGDMMPLEFAIRREIDPQVLARHAMTGLDAAFPDKARRGDIVVAGRRFAQGNPHIQGLLGLKGLGVGLVVESIPRGSFRNAINAGLPMLPSCPGVTSLVRDGDRLSVDFATGELCNETTGTTTVFEPLPAPLLDIIRLGGWRAAFEARLRAANPQELHDRQQEG